MNYEEMSDFEIEQKVSVVINGDNLVRKAPYCSRPEFAWPVIVENEINIEFQDGGFVNAWVNVDSGYFESQIQENPLRAAMICFLKMKDAENEK